MSNLAVVSHDLATILHKDQKRKYTGEPYISHLREVVGIISPYLDRYTNSCYYLQWVPMAIGFLHDAKEDQGLTNKRLLFYYKEHLSDWNIDDWISDTIIGIDYLTDPPHSFGNRAARKAHVREKLQHAPHGYIQDVKYGDVISNAKSIAIHDPKFAKVCLPEMNELLKVLTKGDPGLRKRAMDTVEESWELVRQSS